MPDRRTAQDEPVSGVLLETRSRPARQPHHLRVHSRMGQRHPGARKARAALALAFVPLILATLFQSAPVFAIGQPDAGYPEIQDVQAFRHVLTTDDLLVIVRYKILYASPPTESITQAYFGRLLDGSDELGRTPIYSAEIIPDAGYTTGVWSIYLPADASAYWEQALTVAMVGNPTLSWTGGDPPSRTTTTITWNPSTNISESKPILATFVLETGLLLGTIWEDVLVENREGIDLLSENGETYFQGAVPQLRDSIPLIFQVRTASPVVEPFTGTLPAPTNLWNGTMVDTGFQELGNTFNVSKAVAKSVLWTIVMMVVAVFVLMRGGAANHLLFVLAPLAIAGVVMDFYPFVVAIALGIGAIGAFVWLLFIRNNV